MEIIAACIESGCYSAVFAVLLVYAVRSHAARERYYRKVIDEAVRLGLTDGYMQEKSSAREEYTPPFDLEGV